MQHQNDHGSIELVVLGLLAALVVVLAVPLISGIEHEQNSLRSSAQNDIAQAEHIQ